MIETIDYEEDRVGEKIKMGEIVILGFHMGEKIEKGKS